MPSRWVVASDRDSGVFALLTQISASELAHGTLLLQTCCAVTRRALRWPLSQVGLQA